MSPALQIVECGAVFKINVFNAALYELHDWSSWNQRAACSFAIKSLAQKKTRSFRCKQANCL